MQGSLSTRLRVLRAERGVTLREAAGLTGVRAGTLSELERGLHRPHDITLSRIARGYGIPVEELLEDPVLLGKAEAPEEAGPTPEAGDEARIIDMSPAEFHRRLSEARSKEALLDLYHRVDAERVATELAYRDDENDDHALKDYERGMRFYLMAALSLSLRGETPPDPEKLATRARELEELRK